MSRWINSISLCCLLAHQFPSLHSYPDQNSRISGEDDQTFDFIVVGGGTGGCTVAARLAESGKHTVLLIEAGGLPNPELEIPTYAPRYTNDPTTARNYETVPQLNAGLALNNGVMNYTIGKILGGTSGINGMFVNRGSPHDYNNWARLTGDESWKYDNMLKYFRKYENYSGDYPSDHRGFNGPISIERPSYAPGLPEWFAGARELGYQIGEPNGPQTLSFTGIDYAHKHGRRVSSYTGYIEPMLLRSSVKSFRSGKRNDNLRILIHTEVNRIVFEGKRAVGVKFTSNSKHVGYANSRKEIIVSAGVILSPTLLMRSGVGPKSALESARVPAIKYLPVGRNLKDHVVVFLPMVFGNTSATFIPERDLNPATWRMFNEIGDGPYTSYLGSGGQAFIASSSLSPYDKHLGWPDIQLAALNTLVDLLGIGDLGGDIEEWEAQVSWSSFLTRGKSRGTVTLNPRDIDDPPLIDPRYLSHPDDVQALVDGLKVLLKVCEHTSAFKRIGCHLSSTPFPACSHLNFRSDPYWKCYIRQTATSGLHGGGTCRMGSGSEDPQAVVDTKLAVIGIENLRIVDASIMPVVTNANPHGAVYAIAEKAADMILNQWKLEEKASKLQLGWGQ